MRFGSEPIRIQGKRPYGPPIAISRKGWTSSRYVVLVNAASKTDQLLAGPLAGVYSAPILFVGRNGIPTAVISEIRRLRASRAFVVGGASRVSSTVIAQLPRARISTRFVKRLGGSNDYVTSRLVAAQIRAAKGSLPGVVVVRTDYRYWAAGAVPLAGKFGMPILLTTRFTLPYDAARVLTLYRPKSAIIVGGPGMISSAQGTRIRILSRMHPSRLMRLTPVSAADAAVKLAEYSFSQGMDYANVVLGSSDDLADPLAAGPFVRRLNGMLVLSGHAAMPQVTNSFFQSHCTSIQRVYALGDYRTLLAQVLAETKAAAETIIKAETQVMGEEANGLLTDVSPDLSEMQFQDGAALASVQASDVIVSGPTTEAPYGYLRRVLSVARTSSLFRGTVVSLTTTQAGLEDVFLKGSADVRSDEPPADQTRYGNAFTAQEARAVDATHVDVAFGGSTADAYASPLVATAREPRWEVESAKTLNHTISLDKDLKTDSGGKLYARGRASGKVGYVYNHSVGVTSYTTARVKYWCPRHWRWEYYTQQIPASYGLIKMGMTVGFYDSLSLKLGWTGNFSYNKEMELSPFQLGVIFFMAGPVPVEITMYLTPTIGVNGTFSGGPMEMGTNQTFAAGVGFEYTHSGGLKAVNMGPVSSLTRTGPTTGAGAGADFKCWTDLKVEGLAYNYVGLSPMLVPRLYGKGKVVWSAPSRTVSFEASAGAEHWVGGRVNLFGWVKEWYWGPYARFEKSVGRGSFRYATLRPAPASPSAPAPSAPARAPASRETSAPGEPVSLVAGTVQPADFSIEGLTVTGAQVQPDGSTVRLTTTAQERGRPYTVAVADGGISETGGGSVLGSSAGFAGYGLPAVSGASAVTSKTVDVTFDMSGELDTSTVEPTDFTVEAIDVPEATELVTAAEVQLDGKTVRLTLESTYPERDYRVSVPDDAISAGSLGCGASSADFTALSPTISISAEPTPAPAAGRWGTAVRFAGEDRGWAAYGFWTSVLYTDDGGDTWVKRDGGAVAGTRAPRLIEDFAFPGSNPASAVAVGWSGRWAGGGAPLRSAAGPVSVRATDVFPWDGYIEGPAVCQWTGAGWVERIWSVGSWGVLRGARSCDFSDSQVGYITGYPHALKSTPDGSVTTTDHPQNSMSTTPAADRVPPARLRFAPGGRYGWAVGYSTISRTTDRGITWSSQMTDYPTSGGMHPEGLEGLHVRDSDTAWAVGTTGTILHTTDGGANWVLQESGCPTQTLRGVAFYDAYHGYAVGDDVILHTWDGGETWTRIPHEGTYLGIDAPRFDRAFIVGQGEGGRPMERIELEW